MRARIDALEQQLKDTKREAADDRARLEQELALARAEQARGSSPTSDSESKAQSGTTASRRRSFGVWALFIGAVVAFSGAWFALVSIVFPSEGVLDVRVVTGADGDSALFVSEYVTHSGEDDPTYTTRLAVYDLATGERRSRRVVRWTRRGGLTVLGPGPGGVWAYEVGEGVVLLDPYDGHALREADELMSDALREELLRSGDLDSRVGYLADQQGVVVTLRDGTRVVVDGGEPRPFQGELPPIPAQPHAVGGTASVLASGETVRLASREGDAAHTRRLQPSGGVLLKGTFVEDTGAEQPLVLEGPAGVLVRHRESLEESAAYLLSRVTLDSGQLVWTAKLESTSNVWLAHATGDVVVLVTRTGELMAFGVERGEERYRVDL